jgi:hypothetical protein
MMPLRSCAQCGTQEQDHARLSKHATITNNNSARRRYEAHAAGKLTDTKTDTNKNGKG